MRAYATRTGLAGHTRNSITQLPALERELSKARQYGIARDNEELELGVRCMAAGIYDDQGKLVAGLSISAPADRLDDGWLPKLQATANEISSALGLQGRARQLRPDRRGWRSCRASAGDVRCDGLLLRCAAARHAGWLRPSGARARRRRCG